MTPRRILVVCDVERRVRARSLDPRRSLLVAHLGTLAAALPASELARLVGIAQALQAPRGAGR